MEGEGGVPWRGPGRTVCRGRRPPRWRRARGASASKERGGVRTCKRRWGRWEMGDGRWEMGDGRREMGDGRREAGGGRWEEMGDVGWGRRRTTCHAPPQRSQVMSSHAKSCQIMSSHVKSVKSLRTTCRAPPQRSGNGASQCRAPPPTPTAVARHERRASPHRRVPVGWDEMR
jgi:hypothetical protein